MQSNYFFSLIYIILRLLSQWEGDIVFKLPKIHIILLSMCISIT